MKKRFRLKRCDFSLEKHELRIPAQLRLLSRLLNVSIRRMLQEFIDHASMDICGRGDLERRAAFSYFVQTGYGCQYYYTSGFLLVYF
jgi:hypothetical protein